VVGVNVVKMGLNKRSCFGTKEMNASKSKICKGCRDFEPCKEECLKKQKENKRDVEW